MTWVNRLDPRGILIQIAVLLLASVRLVALDTPRPALALQVSSESAPAGAWTQIQVYSATPQLIVQGSITMDLDPAVFGNITGIAVFSAVGDAIGFATVQSRHLEAHFSSKSGGIGQLPGIPVFTVQVPVLATAPAGSKNTITLDPGTSQWTNPQGSIYSVSVATGDLTVGGTLSIQNATPGGGLLPSGQVLRLDGSGFDATTTVTIDGSAISSPRVLSSQQMELTLLGRTELTGRHMVVKNAAGESVVFFPALPSTPIGTVPSQFAAAGLHLIPSMRPHDSASLYGAMFGNVIGMLNPTLQPVDVRMLAEDIFGQPGFDTVITIAPGTLQLAPPPSRMETIEYEPWVSLRMVEFGYSGLPPSGVVSETSPSTPLLATRLVVSNSPVWDWQAGAGSATVYRAQLKAAARLYGVGLDSTLAQHFIPRRNGVGRRNASDRDSESGLAIGPGWRGGMPGDFGLQVEGFAHQSNENSESVLSRIVRRFCLGTSSVS